MPTLAETIAQACGEATAKALADAKGELTGIAVEGGHAAAGGLLGDVGRVTGIITNLLSDIPVIGGLLTDLVDPLHAVEEGAGKFGTGFGLGYLLGYIGWQLMEPLMLPLIHGVNANTTNQVFDPQTAAQLVSKGVISRQHGRDEAAGGGLDTPHFDQLVEGVDVRPALGELLRLLNLEAIKPADVEQALTREGVPEFWHGPLMELRRQLLSPADLALAVLRGHIDQATMEGYAGQLGVTPDDMQVLVDNTGEPPGLMQLLEAFRRQIIDQPRLERGIRQSRVRNEWIDVVEALRYAPPSPADALRAAVQGHLSQDEARGKAQEAGLNPSEWQWLYETEGDPIARGEALELLHRGVMSEEQVRQAVRESRVKDKYIDDIIALGRRLIPYRTINTILNHGIRDKQWGINYLMSLGYTQDDADALVATSTSAKTAHIKQITEAQVSDLYQSKAIGRAEAQQLYSNLGYDAKEIGYILDALEAHAGLAEQRKAVTAVRAAVIGGRTTIAEASGELDKLGVLATQRDQLLRDWEMEHRAVIRNLTPAQIANTVFYGIWREDYATRKLMALGYSEDDAKVLLDIRLHRPAPHGATEGPG